MDLSKPEALKILGLKSNASLEDVRKAYKRLALQWHPDKNMDVKEAADVFKLVNAAYAFLVGPGGGVSVKPSVAAVFDLGFIEYLFADGKAKDAMRLMDARLHPPTPAVLDKLVKRYTLLHQKWCKEQESWKKKTTAQQHAGRSTTAGPTEGRNKSKKAKSASNDCDSKRSSATHTSDPLDPLFDSSEEEDGNDSRGAHAGRLSKRSKTTSNGSQYASVTHSSRVDRQEIPELHSGDTPMGKAGGHSARSNCRRQHTPVQGGSVGTSCDMECPGSNPDQRREHDVEQSTSKCGPSTHPCPSGHIASAHHQRTGPVNVHAYSDNGQHDTSEGEGVAVSQRSDSRHMGNSRGQSGKGAFNSKACGSCEGHGAVREGNDAGGGHMSSCGAEAQAECSNTEDESVASDRDSGDEHPSSSPSCESGHDEPYFGKQNKHASNETFGRKWRRSDRYYTKGFKENSGTENVGGGEEEEEGAEEEEDYFNRGDGGVDEADKRQAVVDSRATARKLQKVHKLKNGIAAAAGLALKVVAANFVFMMLSSAMTSF